MVFLVVFGHIIEPLITQSMALESIYLSIYSFHIPVFVIISGILSKTIPSNDSIKKLIKNILTPLIVFTVLYESLNYFIEGEISDYTRSFQPYWILWFLFSLFIWRLILPVFMSFRFPVFIAVFLALLAGYFSSINYFLGLSRTLYFFPFFIIGHKIFPNILTNLTLLKLPKIFWLSMLFANFLIFILINDIQPQWLYGSWSYSQLGYDYWYTALIRLLLLSFSLTTSIAVLFLIPKTKLWISNRGKNSLYIYVWHGFIIKIILTFGALNFLNEISVFSSLLIALFSSMLLTIFLSSDKISRYTYHYILLPFSILLTNNKDHQD